MKTAVGTSALALALALATGASATTWNVPSPECPTIQSGLDSATVGDTVLVAPGTYAGTGNRDLVFGGTNLVLMSEAGADSTTVDCEGSVSENHRAFLFTDTEDTNCVVLGFTVTHAWADTGAAVFCRGSSPTLKEMVFVDNAASHGVVFCDSSSARLTDIDLATASAPDDFAALGMYCDASNLTLANVTFSGFIEGGMHCANGSDALIRDCLFIDNHSAFAFGGLRCSDSSPTLERVKFVGNRSTQTGGMLCERSSPTLTDVSFVENECAWFGVGALHCTDGSDPMLVRVEFTGNDGGDTGGLRCSGGSSPTLTDVVFLGNYSNGGDGAMSCIDSSPVLANVIFTQNTSCMGSPGLFIGGDSSPLVENSVFWRNADIEGCANPSALGCSSSAAPVIRNVTISSNRNVNDYGAAIMCSDSTSFENCIVAFTEEAAAVRCLGSASPNFTNCCVFGNAGGDSLCGSYHDNLFVNPLFCDAELGDFTLRDDSPCIPQNNPWGELIGAYGLGDCPTGIPDTPQEMLPSFALHQASPNPSEQTTNIAFVLPEPGSITLTVFDVAGKRVRTLASATPFLEGRHCLLWDGRDDTGTRAASGVYFYRIEMGAERLTGRVVLLR